KARSRLTLVPTCHCPRVVTLSVSLEASKANQPAPFSTTDRQQPLQATDAPRSMEPVSYWVSITSLVTAPGLRSRTLPRAVMMPVNMLDPRVVKAEAHLRAAFIAFQELLTYSFRGYALEAGHLGELCKAERSKGGDPIAADDAGAAEPAQT